MRIVLSDELFTSSPTTREGGEKRPSRLKLATLIHTAYARGHLLETSSEPPLEQWLLGCDEETREELRMMLRASKRQAVREPAGGSYVVQVVVESLPIVQCAFACTLSIEDAQRLVDTKVGIMVENDDSDWLFLLVIAPQEYRPLLEEGRKQDRLEPLHGGGHEILRRLKEHLSTPFKAARTFLLFDSDRLHPDELDPSFEKEGRSIEALKQALDVEALAKERLPDQHWRLRRRAIENYLSLVDLELFIQTESKNRQTGLRSRFDVFRQLSADAQHFFPMKTGLKKLRENKPNWARTKDLYATLSSNDLEILDKGFDSHCFENTHEAVKQMGRSMQFDAAAQEEARRSLHNLWRLL